MIYLRILHKTITFEEKSVIISVAKSYSSKNVLPKIFRLNEKRANDTLKEEEIKMMEEMKYAIPPLHCEET